MNSSLSKFLLLVRFRRRQIARALGAHWFEVFVLGPMILVGFWFVLEPTLERGTEYLRNAAADWTSVETTALGFAMASVMVLAGLPAGLRAVYGLNSPDEYLEALPVGWSTRFYLVLLDMALRSVGPWVFALALLHLLGRTTGRGLPDAVFPVAVLALLQTVCLQVASVLVLSNWKLLRGWRLLLPVVWLVGGWVVLLFHPVGAALLAPLAPPAGFWQLALDGALGVKSNAIFASIGPQLGAVVLAIALAALAYSRLREDSRETARAAASRKRILLGGLSRVLARRLGRPVAAQVARDLRLTLRAFSPVVYVAAGAALLFLAAAQRALETRLVPDVWLGPLLLFLEALACLSLSALAPLLLQRQLPSLWVERAAGVTGEDLWKSKSRFASLVSMPAALAAFGLLLTLGMEPLLVVVYAVRIALVWITVSTVIGTLTIDIAPSPPLGLLFGGLLALALCGMYALDDFWPLGLFFYAYVMHYLAERAETAAAHLGVEA